MRNKGLTFNIILLIFFIIGGGTHYFGFAWDLFAIPTPIFQFTESLFIIILISIIAFIKDKKIIYNNDIIKYYFYFIILLIFIAIINYLSAQVSISKIIGNARSFYTIILIFPLIKLIKTNKQLNQFINLLFIISFIGGITYFYQFLFKIELPASGGVENLGIFRVNQPSILIMIISFFIILGRLFVFGFNKKHNIEYLLGFFLLGIFIITISRGLLISILIGLLFQIIISQTKKHPIILFSRIFIISSISMILYFTIIDFNKINSNPLLERVNEGFYNVQNNTGSFGARVTMFSKKFYYISENYPILGKGFAFETKAEGGNEYINSYNDPNRFNGDGTYQNILLISGYSGLILWLLLLYNNIKLNKLLFKKNKDNNNKSIFLGLYGFAFFIIFYQIAANVFSNTGLTALSIAISISYITNRASIKYIK